MKTVISSILLLFSMNQAIAASFGPGDSVRSHLPNLIDRVRSCSVLPFSYRDGVKVFHALTSHCPEVKVMGPGLAKVKVAAHQYQVSLVEAEDSDGDFYHVQITDLASRDSIQLQNIAAYGDVLLGVLSGDTRGIVQVPVDNSQIEILDINLLHGVY